MRFLIAVVCLVCLYSTALPEDPKRYEAQILLVDEDSFIIRWQCDKFYEGWEWKDVKFFRNGEEVRPTVLKKFPTRAIIVWRTRPKPGIAKVLIQE